MSNNIDGPVSLSSSNLKWPEKPQEKELVIHLEQLVLEDGNAQIEKSLKMDENHYSEEYKVDLEEQTFYFVPRQVQPEPQYFYNFQDLTIFEEDEDDIQNEEDEQQNYISHDEQQNYISHDETENRPESRSSSSYESAYEEDFDEENYEDALEIL